jgi:hypothetical protein
MAKDAPSCKIAWSTMQEVAKEHGIPEVHIHGFMADNAIGPWNAVRDVFFDGVRNPYQERSDAFHFSQSVCRHTQDCIKEGSRMEHTALWERLRGSQNVVQAYKISQDITKFWKDGHVYDGKIKELFGWLAWWVV